MCLLKGVIRAKDKPEVQSGKRPACCWCLIRLYYIFWVGQGRGGLSPHECVYYTPNVLIASCQIPFFSDIFLCFLDIMVGSISIWKN